MGWVSRDPGREEGGIQGGRSEGSRGRDPGGGKDPERWVQGERRDGMGSRERGGMGPKKKEIEDTDPLSQLAGAVWLIFAPMVLQNWLFRYLSPSDPQMVLLNWIFRYVGRTPNYSELTN